ncbi:hypothetical protein ACOMHN_022370 [Nucella lapillus]
MMTQMEDGQSRLFIAMMVKIEGQSRLINTMMAQIDGQSRLINAMMVQINCQSRSFIAMMAQIEGQSRLINAIMAQINNQSRLINAMMAQIEDGQFRLINAMMAQIDGRGVCVSLSQGAVVGGLLGLAIPLWISIGAYNLPTSPYTLPFPTNGCAPITNTTTSLMTTLSTTVATTPTPPEELSGIDLLYTVSYLWYPSIGVAIVIIVGLLVSFITGPMSIDEVDPKYLIPLFDRLFCCLPPSWRRTLRCHRNFPRPERMTFKDLQILTEISNRIAKDIRPDGDETEWEVTADDVEKPPQDGATNIFTVSNGKQYVSSLDSGGGSDVFSDDVTGRNVVERMTTRL